MRPFPDFRLGSELATGFTATLTERCGDPLERIPTPQRLADWFTVVGLAVFACTDDDLARAVELREAIHRAATAAARDEPLPPRAVRVLNDCSARGRAALVLTPQRQGRWDLTAGDETTDALGVIARDAITLLAGERPGRWALCASPTCRAAFFDTSRSRSRRWCEMNTCGNKEKKARFSAAHESPAQGAGHASPGR
ncbi:ABATE domain-containing protein [Tsukamurella sp. M9C]|uniref:CGNR zinc finger domain-containing protein n=1 Tax=Tsukamurella sp. M9C TaxID=2877520 RepID=UPI001CCEDDA8|nr:CGNR zinc finger domain-containing protein [Tsukamurella sp. M9C]MCA0156937.1 ABATE domain-containing protein [Tsukamurella sp. M9C]